MIVHKGKIETPTTEEHRIYNASCDIQERYLAGTITLDEHISQQLKLIEQRVIKTFDDDGIKVWYNDGNIINFYDQIEDDDN